MAEYPNLELLDYIFRQSLRNIGYKGRIQVDVYVFPQTWGNTAGGFYKPGEAAGDAFTVQYTTVLICDHFACVCFGNRPAYLLNNPNKKFFDDFQNRRMESQYKANTCYKDK